MPVGPSVYSQKFKPIRRNGWHLLLGLPHLPLNDNHDGTSARP